MPVPTHDITCKSRAIQLPCDDCGALVWYYSCTCGSKVFFEDLGYPWYRHYCTEHAIKRELEIMVDLEKRTNQEIYDLLISNEKLSGKQVDEKLWPIIESVVGRRRSRLSVEEITPYAGDTEVSGHVMALNNPINIFTRLGYDASNPISIQLLGKLGKSKWASATVRSKPDRQNRSIEHHVLVDQKYLAKNLLRQSNFIVGIASGRLHAKGIVWELVKHDVY